MNLNRFASLLKKKRLALGLTQSKVASMSYLSKSSYNHFERGMRFPTIETLIHLSSTLQTNPSEFLYAILSDEATEENLYPIGILSETTPSDSEFRKDYISGFNLLDQYEQKVILDIIDSMLSSGEVNDDSK